MEIIRERIDTSAATQPFSTHAITQQMHSVQTEDSKKKHEQIQIARAGKSQLLIVDEEWW